MRRLGGVEDEEKWLAEGIAGIQHNAFFMHRALDANNLREVLKYSALMLSELRTSNLSPQKYYDLYMRAFDQLRQLEIFLRDESRYLLCTVGSVYIKSKQAPSKDVLKDLVEMCRGVQHPIRGLFLRSYLAQVSRDKLPEIGSDYQGDANTVMDAVEFVLQNFTEMNKLWVRIQHQGPGTVREKQEKERNELRDLVGKNLHVLGQIEGVHLEMYKETVLPRILEQVVNCKDDFAQYYLMECIIQVFPDEYHLQTLETLLAACTQLMPTVDTKIVLTQLMDRLSNYAVSSPDVLHEFLQVEAFAKLNNAIGKVIDTQIEMPIVGAMTLFVSLLTFALRVHPDRLDYVDQVLGACVVKLSSGPKLEDARAMKQVVALLSAPLEKYNDKVTALTLSNYPRVMDHLDDGTNKVMAMLIIQSIMKNNSCISTADKVEVLFEVIKGLIKDLDGNATEELEEEDFQEEQNSVARLINMLDNEEPEEMLKIICVVRKHLMTGGTRRLPFTIPPLIFSALRLVRQLESQGGDITGEDLPATPRNIFQILNQTIEVLSSVPCPELALRLYLQCAEAASDCDLEPVAYEFFTQAFILYEEESFSRYTQSLNPNSKMRPPLTGGRGGGGFSGGRGGGGFSGGRSGGRGRGFGDRGGGRSGRGMRGRGERGRNGRGAPGRGGMKGGSKVIVEPHRHPGVFIAKGKEDALVTKNLVPGEAVYNEKRISVQNEDGTKTEYRVWNPFRSKLAAAILGGVDNIYIKPGSKVLYLGAASGTTVSHVSDIVGPEGCVYAVEFSHRSGRDLVNMAKKRTNIIPIIEDARHPAKYRMLVGMVDVVFADVAQPDQARIVALNSSFFLKTGGHFNISIKANCIDSTVPAEAVFQSEVKKLQQEQFKPAEQVTLEPFERDHACVVGTYRAPKKTKVAA